MATRSTYGVVVAIEPLAVRAQRKSYVASPNEAAAVVTAVRGTVVTFVPDGDAATKVKIAQPKTLAWRGGGFPVYADGIVVPAASAGREWLEYCEVPTLERFYREGEGRDAIGSEPLEPGDYVRFTVMSSDRLVWDLEFRGRKR